LEKIEMKKTLVAVAALAAIAGAQADVSITGVVESAYSTSSKAKGITTGGNGGSEVRFGGSEDLGSGLKASFSLVALGDVNTESAANYSTATTGNISNYNSFIGLSGDFGSLKLGNQFSPIFNVVGGTTAWGLAANTSTNTQPTLARLSGSVNYSTPSISGFTIAVQGDGNSTNTGYSVTYAAGALTAAYGFNRDTNGDQNAVGLAYDLGAAKLFLSSLSGYIGAKNKSATEVGVSVPFGAASLVASTSSSNATGVKTASNVGVKYDLSKRTQVYYLNTVNGSAATSGFSNGLAAGSVTNIVGLQHAF